MQNNTIRKNEYCHSSSKSMKQEDEELFQLNTIQRITETTCLVTTLQDSYVSIKHYPTNN